jgi:L-threonylcarbamoyladenylate synthase
LISDLGEPLTSTSANRPGAPPAPGAAALARAFAEAVAAGRLLVLDGGVLGNRPPSTVVDCTAPTARLIRPGAIPVGQLRQAVGLLAP